MFTDPVHCASPALRCEYFLSSILIMNVMSNVLATDTIDKSVDVRVASGPIGLLHTPYVFRMDSVPSYPYALALTYLRLTTERAP